jgi:hypothetical protein
MQDDYIEDLLRALGYLRFLLIPLYIWFCLTISLNFGIEAINLIAAEIMFFTPIVIYMQYKILKKNDKI